MRPLIIRGHVWRVVRVPTGDPLLIDRTGMPRVATADPITKTIRMSDSLPISMFDQVYLHEAAHAMMEESGVTDLLSGVSDSVFVEELLAWFLEHHAIEVVDAVSKSLGRSVCVNGLCLGKDSYHD